MPSRFRPVSTALALAFLLLSAGRSDAFGPPTHVEPTVSTEPSAAVKASGVDEKLGARLPPELELVDEKGQRVTLGQVLSREKPTVLTLAYFRCPMLCSLVLKGITKSMAESGLALGEDYEALTVSIDPRDTPETASQWRTRYLEQLGQPGTAPWHYLTGPEAQVRQLTDAVGFGYAYDAASDQYAHSAVALVISPKSGTVSRYLYGVDFPAMDLRLAITEAAQGKVGISLEKVILSCFKYDPATRRYGFYVFGFLRIWWLVGFVMAAALVVLIRRSSRRQPPPGDGSAPPPGGDASHAS